MHVSALTTATAAPLPSESPTRVISSDFETFLKMLTAQMKNQDPLNPVDSSDYAVQLATFSGVEQAVLTNDLLEALSSQMNVSGMAQMAGWVGKEARAAAAGYFDGSPITVSPNPALLADEVEMVVTNSDGIEVQRLNIPITSEPIEWAGLQADGQPMPSGLYSFEIVSYSNGEVLLSEQADIYSRVQEVRSEGGEIILMLEGGAAILASNVTALRDPAYF